nr:tripartite tricarboxylate transporter substrate-binding protein [Pelistega indica]
MVEKLDTEIQKIMENPEFQEKLKNLGAETEFVGSKELSRRVFEEYNFWKSFVEKTNLAVDIK